MNSSTSSSETSTAPPTLTRSRHSDSWRAILFMLLILFAVDRFTQVLVSRVFRNGSFTRLPKQAQKLKLQTGLKIALVGNSTTDRGAYPDQFAHLLEKELKVPVHADKFPQGGTNIHMWYYLSARYLWEQGLKPDLMVIAFRSNDLEDGMHTDIGRLAQLVTKKEIDSVWSIDVPKISDRMALTASFVSNIYASRQLIKYRIPPLFVPHLNGYLKQRNEVIYSHTKAPPANDETLDETQSETRQIGEPTSHPTYKALVRFLQAAKQNKTRICFVAYPINPSFGSPPPIQAEALNILRSYGMDYIDLHKCPELAPSVYADRVHLTPAGQKLWTPILSRAIAPILAQQQLQP